MSATLSRHQASGHLDDVRAYVLKQVEQGHDVSPSSIARKQRQFSSHDIRLAILQLVEEGELTFSPNRKLIAPGSKDRTAVDLTRW